MTKIYTREINNCGECPDCVLRPYDNKDWCKRISEFIPQDVDILDACPLKDKDGKTDGK